jgi:hypothetical protein
VVARVECRLPAADLRPREVDVEAGLTEEELRVGDRVGEDEVAQAGGEELDTPLSDTEPLPGRRTGPSA